jgi:hypothetical protein
MRALMSDVMLQWAARTTPWFVMTRLIALTTPAMLLRVVSIHQMIACAVTMMNAALMNDVMLKWAARTVGFVVEREERH